MKYILNEGILAWAKQDFEAHIAFMHKLNKELKETGEFVLAGRTGLPSAGETGASGKDGTRLRMAFFRSPKSSSPASGLSTLRPPSALARSLPGPQRRQAPGALNMQIAVRPIMSAPPKSL